MSEEGRKNDQEKVQLELIPASLIWAVGTILTFGARKYAARNWEKGFAWSRAFGALQRHLWAWWQGEEADPETGKSHLWHAGCELAFLIEFEKTHRELDDRPKGRRDKSHAEDALYYSLGSYPRFSRVQREHKQRG